MALISLLSRLDLSRVHVTLWIQKSGGILESRVPEGVEVRYWDEPECGGPSHTRDDWSWRSMTNRLISKVNLHDFDRNLKYYIKSKPVLTSEKYDAVVAYFGYLSEAVFTALYRLTGTRKILWMHGDYSASQIPGSFWENEYKRFDRVICVSYSSREAFLEKYPEMKNKTEVIHNVINRDEIRKAAGEEPEVYLEKPSIVTVGRLSVEKGQDRIPQITRLILDRGIDLKWYIIGDGPLRDRIVDEIKKERVENHVFLLGIRENPYPYISCCDVYVQPSLKEGYCLSTLEAKALWRPCVVTDVPGMKEQFCNGKNGFIVDKNDIAQLEDTIYRLLLEQKLRDDISSRLRMDDEDDSAELEKIFTLMSGD